GANPMPRITDTDVFYANEKDGWMCRVDVQGAIDEPVVVVVAPITHLAFNRRHPIAHDIAAYRKRRTEAAAVTGRGVHEGSNDRVRPVY
ncbi:MAG TPA: hypothetical protein VME69_14670, partial [Methylocella sp.]|nr:hypothetical protein [Methylocella sp.]